MYVGSVMFKLKTDQPPIALMDDTCLPVRLRDRYGRWIRGQPTKVHIYTVNGEKVAVWTIPSTEPGCTLCCRAAKLYLMNPSRFKFTMIDMIGPLRAGDTQVIIDYDTTKPLNWILKFQPWVSMQIVISMVDIAELFEIGDEREFGWRPLRNWRRLYRCIQDRHTSDIV